MRLQLVENFRKNPQAPKSQGASFERGAFEKILAQPGCEKIKMYWAQENGNFTVVLVGVDKEGKDMVPGSIMERSSYVSTILRCNILLLQWKQ